MDKQRNVFLSDFCGPYSLHCDLYISTVIAICHFPPKFLPKKIYFSVFLSIALSNNFLFKCNRKFTVNKIKNTVHLIYLFLSISKRTLYLTCCSFSYIYFSYVVHYTC